MAARTTTGIVLTLTHRTGTYTVQRPDQPDITIGPRPAGQPEVTFDECARAAGLSSGYWLRQYNTGGTTTWTWVQL